MSSERLSQASSCLECLDQFCCPLNSVRVVMARLTAAAAVVTHPATAIVRPAATRKLPSKRRRRHQMMLISRPPSQHATAAAVSFLGRRTKKWFNVIAIARSLARSLTNALLAANGVGHLASPPRLELRQCRLTRSWPQRQQQHRQCINMTFTRLRVVHVQPPLPCKTRCWGVCV